VLGRFEAGEVEARVQGPVTSARVVRLGAATARASESGGPAQVPDDARVPGTQLPPAEGSPVHLARHALELRTGGLAEDALVPAALLLAVALEQRLDEPHLADAPAARGAVDGPRAAYATVQDAGHE